MRFLWLIFSLLPFLAFADTATHVARVVDGDTIVTTEGESVRLLGINSPETGGERGAEPFGAEATAIARTLLDGEAIILKNDTNAKDRYGRRLSHIYLQRDGSWVNGELVRRGAAHVYSFPDNRGKLDELLTIEAEARDQKNGLWALPRWEVLSSDGPFKRRHIGQFHLVEGVVKNAARVRGIVYLNFGDDWRTDFTVEIRADDVRTFTDSGINPATAYTGKRVRARGHLKPVNGVLITATHPEQIEILDKNKLH